MLWVSQWTAWLGRAAGAAVGQLGHCLAGLHSCVRTAAAVGLCCLTSWIVTVGCTPTAAKSVWLTWAPAAILYSHICEAGSKCVAPCSHVAAPAEHEGSLVLDSMQFTWPREAPAGVVMLSFVVWPPCGCTSSGWGKGCCH